MEAKEFKENVVKLLNDVENNHYKPVVVENIIHKFQDDNVEYLELQ